MANYRSVHVKIWSDPFFSELKSEAQHIFLYLITNEHRTESGLYPLPLKTIAFETNQTVAQVKKILSQLEPKVKYDYDGQVVWVVNIVKHLGYHIGNSEDKRFISICNDLSFNNTMLVNEFLKVYPQFKEGVSKGSIRPLARAPLRTKVLGIRTKEQGLRTKEENPENVDNFPDSKHLELAELLKSKILENNPKALVKDTQVKQWTDDVRLMVERDGRTFEEIKSLIVWSQQDEFWHKNILSMSKLRKQFDQLWLKAREDQPDDSAHTSSDPFGYEARAERERIEDEMDKQAKEKEQAARWRSHDGSGLTKV